MSQNASELNASKDRVVSNFQGLIAGAEDLLRTTAAASGEGVDAARRNFRTYLDSARGTLADVESMALERYKRTSDATDVYVRANPWRAVGIAAVVGLLVGFFANRR